MICRHDFTDKPNTLFRNSEGADGQIEREEEADLERTSSGTSVRPQGMPQWKNHGSILQSTVSDNLSSLGLSPATRRGASLRTRSPKAGKLTSAIGEGKKKLLGVPYKAFFPLSALPTKRCFTPSGRSSSVFTKRCLHQAISLPSVLPTMRSSRQAVGPRLTTARSVSPVSVRILGHDATGILRSLA